MLVLGDLGEVELGLIELLLLGVAVELDEELPLFGMVWDPGVV